jgi:hypothetical protein
VLILELSFCGWFFIFWTGFLAVVAYAKRLGFGISRGTGCLDKVVDASIRWHDVEGAWVKLNAGWC